MSKMTFCKKYVVVDTGSLVLFLFSKNDVLSFDRTYTKTEEDRYKAAPKNDKCIPRVPVLDDGRHLLPFSWKCILNLPSPDSFLSEMAKQTRSFSKSTKIEKGKNDKTEKGFPYQYQWTATV